MSVFQKLTGEVRERCMMVQIKGKAIYLHFHMPLRPSIHQLQLV